MADVDALVIKISAQTGRATKQINKLVSALDGLNEALGKIDPSALNTVAQASEKVSTAMSGLAQSGKEISVISSSMTSIAKSAGNLAQAGNAIQQMSDSMERASASSVGSANATEQMAEGARHATESTRGLTNASQIANTVIKSLGAGFKTFTGTLKQAGKFFKNVASHALSAAKGISGFGKSSRSSKSGVSSLVKELTRITKMLKLMITRMVLRKVIEGITDGFKNLAQYSHTFDASLSLLWNDFRQLGNSIAAATSPLVNAFAPAIHYIIQLCIQAVNAINQLLSALTGLGKWTKAKSLTDSYAKSLEKAGGAAKELKKTVLGFDELNQLQDNKSSGGGGTSPADMFEEAPIDKKWADWAKKIKDMWKVGDFTKLGKAIGQWLLNALNSIPWNKIKAKAYKLGKSFATLLNGIIETPELGRTLGKTLAEAINTAVMYANGFVRNFHWDSLGKFIGEMFNGFFENIDWYYIKDTVVTGLRGLASTIQNFIKTFNWDNISKTLVNALDVISAGIKAFFENIDWEDLGEKVGTQITKTLKEANWKQVGEAIGDIIQAAIGFAAGLIRTFSWSDLISAILDALKGVFKSINYKDLATVIGEVLKLALLASIAKAGWAALTTKVAGWFATTFGAAEVTKAVTEGAAKAVAEGTAEAVAGSATATEVATAASGAGLATAGLWAGGFVGGIAQFISQMSASKTIGFKIAELFGYDKDVINQLSESYTGLSGTIGFYTDVLEMSYYAMTGDIDKAKEVISTNNEVQKSAETTKDSIGKIYDTKAAESLKNMKTDTDSLKESLNHIADTKAAEGLKRMRESAGFKEIADNAKNLETTISNTQKTVNDATTSIGEDWKGTQEEVSTAVTTMSTDISDGMTTIQTTVTDCMTEVTASFDTIKEGMTKDKWTFDGVAEGLGETFRKAKEAIKREWNEIANTLNGNHTVGTSSININLPKFANGGFPRENGLFMANSTEMVGKFSNGKTAVANNEQITDGIARAVFNAMTSAQANGGSQYINNTIMVDGDVIARAVTKGQERLNRRYSPAMG